MRGSRVDRTDTKSSPTFPAFQSPDYVRFFLSGIPWFWARWGLAFLAAFHVNDVTDSPRLVQLTGTSMWAPMLLGGVIGGVIADRYNRVLIVRLQLLTMVPIAGGLGVLELMDQLDVWMIYPLLVLAGFTWVSDMTSRKSLVVDLVGPDRLDNAMALEATSQASGMVIGNLLGGVIVAVFGIASAFLVLAGLFGASFLLFLRVPTWHGKVASTSHRHAFRELRDGFGLLRSNPALRSILGITVLANLFFFAYFPAVQRIGDRLDASPSQVGLLASMAGVGAMTAGLLIAVLQPRRSGLLYVGGVLFAMVMLIPFALAGSLAVAVGALYVASIGGGLFGSTQSALVLSVADASVRGRAMGLLGMSIGALPIGSTVLGELAERWGVGSAIVVMVMTGMICVVIWASTTRLVLMMTTAGAAPPRG